MTEEFYKICMMCSKVYEGDVRKYDGKNVSHGVCPDPQCITDYIIHASGGDSCLIEILKKELLVTSPRDKKGRGF